MAALISIAAIVQSTDILAQHVSDNPVTAADDAYGLTLGWESVGSYSPGLVRGFSPKSAGKIGELAVAATGYVIRTCVESQEC